MKAEQSFKFALQKAPTLESLNRFAKELNLSDDFQVEIEDLTKTESGLYSHPYVVTFFRRFETE